MAYILVAALVFGVCHLVDRGFTRFFRSRTQHQSGLAVRNSKRYAVFGLFLVVLAVLSLIVSDFQNMALLLGGVVVLLMGIGLIVHYLSFGVYYDDDSFLYSRFGRKNAVYRFSDIRSQQLFVLQGGGMIVELLLADGQALSLQTAMDGVYPFLNHAFAAWCRQTDRDPEDCRFHDPSQCRWFPETEAE